MTEGKMRAALESEIIKRAKFIALDAETHCFDEQHLYEYIEAWHQLAIYFRENEDTSIGVEVVREYRDSLDYLFGIWKHGDVSDECRERAEEALRELEAYMRDIFEAVELTLSSSG